jgi:uncharacterized protein YqeY
VDAGTSLTEQIQADVVAAMKSGDKRKLETLRTLQSELKYRQIELRAPLGQADAEAVLRRAAKKRREAIEAFQKGQREDLAGREAAELTVIEAYLPPELSDDRLNAIIRDVLSEVQAGADGPPQLGRIMSAVMPRVQGQASGERVRARVQSLLQEQ